MATEKDLVIDGSHSAGADLSAVQNKFVKINTSGQIVVMAAITDIPFGILQNKPDAQGKGADVARAGSRVKIQANATLDEGDLIGTSADGQADPIAAGSDTTVYIVGTCVEGVTNADELATISLDCFAPSRAS